MFVLSFILKFKTSIINSVNGVLFRQSVYWLQTHKFTHKKLFACLSHIYLSSSICMFTMCKQHCILGYVVFQAVKHSFSQKYNWCLFRIIPAKPLALFTLFYENENTNSWRIALKLDSLNMHFLGIVQDEICTLWEIPGRRNTRKKKYQEKSFSGPRH